MAAQFSETDLLIVGAVVALMVWQRRRTVVAVKPAAQVIPANQIVPVAQSVATANVWGALGSGLAQIIGTSANVASANIASNAPLAQPVPTGAAAPDATPLVGSGNDGFALNPSGNVSPYDYATN